MIVGIHLALAVFTGTTAAQAYCYEVSASEYLNLKGPSAISTEGRGIKGVLWNNKDIQCNFADDSSTATRPDMTGWDTDCLGADGQVQGHIRLDAYWQVSARDFDPNPEAQKNRLNVFFTPSGGVPHGFIVPLDKNQNSKDGRDWNSETCPAAA